MNPIIMADVNRSNEATPVGGSLAVGANYGATGKASSPTGYPGYTPPVLEQPEVEEEQELEEHKTILVGDSGVGKTSILVQFDLGKFQSSGFSATVGIGFTRTFLFTSCRICAVGMICDQKDYVV